MKIQVNIPLIQQLHSYFATQNNSKEENHALPEDIHCSHVREVIFKKENINLIIVKTTCIWVKLELGISYFHFKIHFTVFVILMVNKVSKNLINTKTCLLLKL